MHKQQLSFLWDTMSSIILTCAE